jgi:hypothetical protein
MSTDKSYRCVDCILKTNDASLIKSIQPGSIGPLRYHSRPLAQTSIWFVAAHGDEDQKLFDYAIDESLVHPVRGMYPNYGIQCIQHVNLTQVDWDM